MRMAECDSVCGSMLRIVVSMVMAIVASWMPAAAGASVYSYEEGYGMHFGWERSTMVRAFVPTALIFYADAEFTDGRYTHLVSYSAYNFDNRTVQMVVPYNSGHGRQPVTALGVTYTGQRQAANGSTAHLAAYDQMMTRGALNAGSTFFSFRHSAALVRVAFRVRKGMTAKTLALGCGTDKFTADATLNLEDTTMTPATLTDAVTLDFDDVSLAKGDTLVAYMMVAPADLASDTLTVELLGANGEKETAKVSGVNFLAGKMYNIGVGVEESNTMLRGEDAMITPQPSGNVKKVVAYTPDFLLAETSGDELKERNLLGDVNRDGAVTMADANMIVNMYLSGNVDDFDLRLADINNDGQVTMADANMVVNIYLGI